MAANKASRLQRKHWVTKRNALNELRPNDMTLQELRFFTVYLSKINPLDENTRLVRFTLNEFQRIFEQKKINTSEIIKISFKLLAKAVAVPLECGGLEAFQLFKTFKVFNTSAAHSYLQLNKTESGQARAEFVFEDRGKTESSGGDYAGEWFVEIDAHDKALPLMFNLKSHYFKYQLWNALRLKSVNQLRIYEVLKQYEYLGERVLYVEELKFYLGIGKGEYPRFGDFKDKVLNVCQKALAAYTDITFTYEPYGRKGKGGKIIQLRFIISKNKDHQDPLTLEKFIEPKDLGTEKAPGKLDPNTVDPETSDWELEEMIDSGLISRQHAQVIFMRPDFPRLKVEDLALLFETVMGANAVAKSGPMAEVLGRVFKHIKYWYANALRVEANGDIEKSFFGYLKKTVVNPMPCSHG